MRGVWSWHLPRGTPRIKIARRLLLGFTNEYTDATGLLYLRARYYDPKMGRFFQMDPSRQERNPFQYSLSNPVNYADPSGLSASQTSSLRQVMPLLISALPDVTVPLLAPCEVLQASNTDLWFKTTSGTLRGLTVFFPPSITEPGDFQTFIANIKDGVRRYNDRLTTVNTTFRNLFGPADVIIVDALENYLPNTPAVWKAIHSVSDDNRNLDQFPDWVKTDLAQRSGTPIIFIELNALLINGVEDGTALVMHE